MPAFSSSADRMASEPIDFSPAEATAADGADVIPLTTPTVVAFIGRTERGPLNEPVRIKSFEQFSRIFGGQTAFSFMSLAVQHFFWHGGEVAVIVRVANRATRATIDIPAGRETLRLQARQPGSREHLRVSVDYDRVERTPDKFNLTVQRLARADSQLVDDQEVFENVSMDPTDERFIVDVLHGSELVRLVGPLPGFRPSATRPTVPGHPIPYISVRQPGSDGDELTDYDIIGSNNEGTGLFALDQCQRVDLVCVPSPPWRDLGRGRRPTRPCSACGPPRKRAGTRSRTSRASGRAATSAATPPASRRAASSRACSRVATWAACGIACRPPTPRSKAVSRRCSK
jgi:hypothetical protein